MVKRMATRVPSRYENGMIIVGLPPPHDKMTGYGHPSIGIAGAPPGARIPPPPLAGGSARYGGRFRLQSFSGKKVKNAGRKFLWKKRLYG